MVAFKKVLTGKPPSKAGSGPMVSGREKGPRRGKTLQTSVAKRKVR